MRLIAVIPVLLMLLLSCSLVHAEPIQEQVAALATKAGAEGVVTGKDGWLFLKEELEHLGSNSFFGAEVVKTSKASKPEFADPLPAIVDFNNQLKKRGIDLLFVPIPPKSLIYPDKLPGDLTLTTSTALDKPYKALYEQLAEQGVHVIDLIPVFRKARDKDQLYCKTDSHFSGAGLNLVADLVAGEIKQASWYKDVSKAEFITKKKQVKILGDLVAMQKGDVQEAVSLEFVTDVSTGKRMRPVADSPVLLLGDSHTLVFSVGGDLHATGAGLFDILTADLGFPVDLLGVRGSGATPSRIKLYQRSRKNPSFLKKKKVVVWCLAARELTGKGGWRKIPVAKKEQ